MDKVIKKLLFVFIVSLCLAGCGRQEEVEEEALRVIGLTITPPPVTDVPKAAPVDLDKAAEAKAVASQGGTTFINQYLLNEANGITLK